MGEGGVYLFLEHPRFRHLILFSKHCLCAINPYILLVFTFQQLYSTDSKICVIHLTVAKKCTKKSEIFFQPDFN